MEPAPDRSALCTNPRQGSGFDPLLHGEGQGLCARRNLGRQVSRGGKVRRGQRRTGEIRPNAPSYTTVFGQALTQLAEKDSKIVGITAAMPSGTGLDIFAQRFADRMFDVGIAEQHGVTFAAGLAASGLKPFCAIYSTFLQRGYDQIVHDVALQNLPVRFAIDRAGLVGADGATHAGAFDIGFLTALAEYGGYGRRR